MSDIHHSWQHLMNSICMYVLLCSVLHVTLLRGSVIPKVHNTSIPRTQSPYVASHVNEDLPFDQYTVVSITIKKQYYILVSCCVIFFLGAFFFSVLDTSTFAVPLASFSNPSTSCFS